MTERSDGDVLWAAAGILMAAQQLSVEESLAVMEARAFLLRVPVDDVAAFVQYRGTLPDLF